MLGGAFVIGVFFVFIATILGFVLFGLLCVLSVFWGVSFGDWIYHPILVINKMAFKVDIVLWFLGLVFFYLVLVCTLLRSRAVYDEFVGRW